MEQMREEEAGQNAFGQLIEEEYQRIERMKADNEVTDFSSWTKSWWGFCRATASALSSWNRRCGAGTLMAPEIAWARGGAHHRGHDHREPGRNGVEPAGRGVRGGQEVQRAVKGPDGDAQSLRSLAQSDQRQQPAAPGGWSCSRRCVPSESRRRTRLDLLQGKHRGEYISGNKGIQVNEDLAVDFKVQTKQGSERIARAAFEFARKNGKKNVTIVTKANIVKLADGNFIKAVRKVGEEYPEIEIQERLVDAMCAKMLDPEFNKGIEVIVLPNLYGDIVTDVAAEHQGGLGTASSSNLGNKYAMFEAIHGTAPYLIEP